MKADKPDIVVVIACMAIVATIVAGAVVIAIFGGNEAQQGARPEVVAIYGDGGFEGYPERVIARDAGTGHAVEYVRREGCLLTTAPGGGFECSSCGWHYQGDEIDFKVGFCPGCGSEVKNG